MPQKRVIETGVDKLVRLISQKKTISLKDAAKELGVSVSNVEEWADFLEEEGLINVQTKLATVYLVEQKLTKSQAADKVKECNAEKDLFIRKLNSSLTGLEGESQEIKKISSEFNSMKGIVSDNFKKLSEQLDSIEHFKSKHEELDERRKDLEDKYNERLKALEKRIDKDKETYESLLKSISSEEKEIDHEKKDLADLEKNESDVSHKIDEFGKTLSSLKSMMEDDKKKIDVSESKIKSSEKLAEEIKQHISDGIKEIEELDKSLHDSKRDVAAMEKEFLANMDKISKGNIGDLDAYKKSRDLVEKFKKFFEKSSEINSILLKADKDEGEIRSQLERLIKKTKSVHTIMNSDPAAFADLEKEFIKLEEKKKDLKSKMSDLRSAVKNIFS